MTNINLSNNGNSPFEQLIGHNNSALMHWTAIENPIIEDSSLSPDLLEQVQRALIFSNGCEYFIFKGVGQIYPKTIKENNWQPLLQNYTKKKLKETRPQRYVFLNPKI